MNNGIVLSAGA
jgi:hypothetical protein